MVKKNLQKDPPAQAGFTLMEMLLVVGLVALVGGITVFIDFGNYRGTAFRSEINSLGSALQVARANSLNNIHESRHGVAVRPGGYDGYVIFEGDNYASSTPALEQRIKISYDINFGVGSPTEIVFDQLSGNANFDGDIVMIDPARNFEGKITINHEGKISW